MSLEEEIRECSGSLEKHDEEWSRSFYFGKDFIAFAGHFPGNPVLPAFVQLHMARLLWTEIMGKDSVFIVKAAKFMNPIRPDDKLIMRLCKNRIDILCSVGLAATIRVQF